MKEKYFLSIDVGTQSIRVMIFNNKGETISKIKKEYKPYFSTAEKFAEQDADLYWQIICEALRLLKEENELAFNFIEGVSLVTMRNTIVLVDKKGETLGPAILWLDQRLAVANHKINKFFQIGVSLIGQKKKVDTFRKVFKWQWIKENQPERAEKTYKYLLLSTYLNYKLTGFFKDSQASQIGYVPYDFKKRKWADKYNVKSVIFNIDQSKLADLVEVGSVLGEITEVAERETGLKRGLKVIASGSDKGCETIGAGCIDSVKGNLSLGSAVTIQTTHHKYVEMSRFVPSYPAAMPEKYNPEVQINRGYWMISWFVKEFAEVETQEAKTKQIPVEILLNDLLDKVPAGADGLMLQPFWGADLNDPYAKGAVIGFTDVSTRAHLYRAIIEGITYAVMEGIELIEKRTHAKMEKIIISGGGSQSDNICQITADMTGLIVARVQTYETACLGAAVIGFVGIGVYGSYEEAVGNMVVEEKVFQPNKALHNKYMKLYKNAYRKIYPKLKKIYKELDSVIKV